MLSMGTVFDSNLVVQFVNCTLVSNGKIVREDLWLRGSRIINPESLFYDEKKRADIRINCGDNLIAPGYIDLQINGGFGYDFSDDSIDVKQAVKHVGLGILKAGVTSFCPTLITQSSESYHKILPQIKRRQGNAKQGASILGVHLEGPFINRGKKGAHPVQLVQDKPITLWSTIENCYGYLDGTSIVTIAPELDEGGIISQLHNRGIVVSIGHSKACLKEGLKALDDGANFITHLFNAMVPFHHRDPGLVGLITARPQDEYPVYYGIICDNVHTHESALRIAYRSNPNGCVLVTDAISAMGLPQGITHQLGDQIIEIRNEKAFVAGTDTLCGSIATMDQCVRNLKKATGCDVVEAINCASLHPARVLGISHRKGTLNYGSDGDLIILDQSLNVLATFINGQLVWKDDNFGNLKII